MPASTTGYPDWAKLSQEDSPVLLDEHLGVVHNAQGFITAALDVRRFTRLAGTLSTTKTVAWSFVYFLDQAATINVGTRTIITGTLIGGSAQFNIPVLGPWCRVSIFVPAGTPVTSVSAVFATNRDSPYELIPPNVTIMDQAPAPMGIAATITLAAQGYWCGPAQVFCSSTAPGNIQLQGQFINAAGVLEPFSQNTLGANGQFNVIIPPAVWQMQVTNSTGAITSIQVVITPSLTGAT